MKMPSLENQKAASIIRCLKHIEENEVSSGNGNSSIMVDALYFFTEEIFREVVPGGQGFPERTWRGIISKAQFRWLKYKKTDSDKRKLSLFLQAIRVEIAKAKKSHYLVLMFLNIDHQSIPDYKSVKILDNAIRFISWQEVSALDVKGLWEEFYYRDRKNQLVNKYGEDKKPLPDYMTFTPVLLETETWGPEAAVEIGSDCIDLVRAVFNIPYTLGGFTFFSSQPQALSKVLPSPAYVIFTDDGKRDSVYYTIELFHYKKEKIDQRKKISFDYLLSKISVPPPENSSWKYLLDVLRLYQKCLDISSTEIAFLTMWQVLEKSVCLGDEWTKNRDIQKRASVFVKMDPISLDMLNIVISQRNKFVHFGQYLEKGDAMFSNLKLITDAVIRSFIYLADQYPTLQELKEYVSLSTLGDSDLERKKYVIEKILSQRKNKE